MEEVINGNGFVVSGDPWTHTHTRMIRAIALTQRYLIHSIVTFYCIDLEEETDYRKDIELCCIEK